MSDCDRHSFMIRIWKEEEGQETRSATWRGHITHSLSGTRRYVSELSDITEFITPYISAMTGVTHPDTRSRTGRILHRVAGVIRRT